MRTVLGRHVVPAAVAAIFVLPLWMLLVGALRPLGLPPPTEFELFPPSPTTENLRLLGELLPVGVYLRNSAVVVALAVPITILIASWAGFGIRLLPVRAKRLAVLLCVVVLLVPASATWTTRFEVYRVAGLIGTVLPVVAPALMGTTPFFVLLYAWSFHGVPDSQVEAARLEGARLWTIWRVLALPQARMATLAVGVLAFTFHWGNFLDALLYLRGQQTFTLPLGLNTLKLLRPTEFPLLLAGALVYTLPSVGAFLLAQRLFLDDSVAALRRGGPRRRRSA